MSNLAKVGVVRTGSEPRPPLASGRTAEPAATPGLWRPHEFRDALLLHRDRVPAIVWARPDMRQRLSERDVAGVYRLLQSHGVSQRAIAASTGQSQSEVSEILAGR